MRSQMLVQLAQIEETIDAAPEVMSGNVVFEIEGIEQRRLAGILSSHHLVRFHSPDGEGGGPVATTNFKQMFLQNGR